MPRGGPRPGAGRPRGTGRYGEPTRPVRVPERMVDRVRAFVAQGSQALPLYQARVAAGFPSPADDYLEGTLDLNEHLIQNAPATFFVRVAGESMTGAGIFPDDILIVDRSLEPKNGDVIIAIVDGELTVKRLHRHRGKTELRAENPAYPPIVIHGDMTLQTWGVVRHVVHSLKG